MILFEDYHIEPIQSDDAFYMHQLMISNTERFKDFFPGTLAQNLTIELSQEFVVKKSQEHTSREEFLFTIKQKSTQEIAGVVYIKELDWDKKKGEFAYCIGEKHGGKGLISESIELLSAYAFAELGLEILEIIVHKTNIPSVRVAKKCGFVWEKTLLNEFKPKDRPIMDMELYLLVKL